MDGWALIPAITALCYLAGEVYKALTPERLYKHIPVFCAMVGMILGLCGYMFLPGFLPAENAMVAAAMGTVSGWAATGANQSIIQQVRK